LRPSAFARKHFQHGLPYLATNAVAALISNAMAKITCLHAVQVQRLEGSMYVQLTDKGVARAVELLLGAASPYGSAKQ